MERSRDWMAQAEGDLDMARLALREQRFDWACFAAQQAGEKAAKAVYEGRLHAEVRGHAVSDLLAGLRERFRVDDELIDEAKELDQAYSASRYPNAHPSGAPKDKYTRKQAERLIGYADEILRVCHDLLSRP